LGSGLPSQFHAITTMPFVMSKEKFQRIVYRQKRFGLTKQSSFPQLSSLNLIDFANTI